MKSTEELKSFFRQELQLTNDDTLLCSKCSKGNHIVMVLHESEIRIVVIPDACHDEIEEVIGSDKYGLLQIFYKPVIICDNILQYHPSHV